MGFRTLRLALASAAIVASSALLVGHVRLHVPSTGNELFWSDPANIGIVINEDGSDNIFDGSHITALRNAIDAWNRIQGTTVQLVEDASPAQMARTDWESGSLHLLLFDEDNSSGYFPGGSQTVAITPLWFFNNGSISDGDVLFNGKNFNFTTEGASGRFDVADVAVHELGHLLGLDHSGVVGSSMFPYVDPTVILHRSPGSDDEQGMRDIYPGGAFGQITGTVKRAADDSTVAGAYVVALDAAGRVAGSALAEPSGGFSLRGLDDGTYTVYATPLDEPVGILNLSTGHVVETDFEPTFYGPNAVVSGAGTAAMGDLLVGADVAINLGVNSDALPLGAISGSTVTRSLRGSGLTFGSTLTASDPAVGVTTLSWLGSQVSFQISVPGGAAPGHFDLMVTNGSGERAILPGAIEVRPPSPSVSSVVPSSGTLNGGTALTLSGTGFLPGARVVIGDQIYVDGEPGGATVVGPTAITLTTRAMVAGIHDVVVIDATGVEGRQQNGYAALDNPTIDTLFPPSGAAAGGTELVLTGSDFVAGLAVRIDGVVQTNVTVDNASRVRVVTEGGLPGGPYTVEIENPGGGVSTSSFVYVAQADPSVAAVTPSAGPAAGGDLVTLTGTGFTAASQVRFGVDPDTGAGGVAADSVTFVDANTLEIVTPAHSPGLFNLLVSDGSTDQASVVASAFAFQGAGGGGGGCASTSSGGTRLRLGEVLAGTWWLLAALLGAALVSRRGSRRPQPEPVRVTRRR